MIKVIAIQEYLLVDCTLDHKTFVFVKHNSALIIGPNTQIDLLHDLSTPRPVNEKNSKWRQSYCLSIQV